MDIFKKINKLIRSAIGAAMADVHTHIIAQVVSYDAAENTCSIQPCIKRIRTEDASNMSTIDLPQIDDVPVSQFGSGKLLCAVAPQKSSYGVFHVSERSVDSWMLNGGTVSPSSARRFDLGDGFFCPGAYPLKIDGDNGLIVEPIRTDRVEIRTRDGKSFVAVTDSNDVEIQAFDNSKVTLKNDGTITMENSAGSVTLKSSGVTEIGGAGDSASLASQVDAHFLKFYTLLTTWVVVATDGGLALKTAALAAFPTPPSSVASNKLKVDS